MSLIPFRTKRSTGMEPGLATLADFRTEMNRLFEGFLSRPGMASSWFETPEPGQWLPAIDMSESDKEIHIRAELPGIAPEDVDVSVSEDRLVIAGEKKSEREAKGNGWVAVGDENYGEGSSREHAAMCPRHLGCKAVITRSFARIHETNLKKQGVLPLTFIDKSDYEKIQQGDRIDLIKIVDIAPGSSITAVLHHRDGSSESLQLTHSLNDEQIDWFKAGSALNHLRAG